MLHKAEILYIYHFENSQQALNILGHYMYKPFQSKKRIRTLIITQNHKPLVDSVIKKNKIGVKNIYKKSYLEISSLKEKQQYLVKFHHREEQRIYLLTSKIVENQYSYPYIEIYTSKRLNSLWYFGESLTGPVNHDIEYIIEV